MKCDKSSIIKMEIPLESNPSLGCGWASGKPELTVVSVVGSSAVQEEHEMGE